MIIKVGILGILAVFMAVLFKNVKPEYSTYIGMVTALLIAMVAFHTLHSVLKEIENLQQYLSQGGGFLRVLLKMVGITYICEFVSSICKDAGYQSIAGQIDVFGKLCVIITGFPIIHTVFEMLERFL